MTSREAFEKWKSTKQIIWSTTDCWEAWQAAIKMMRPKIEALRQLQSCSWVSGEVESAHNSALAELRALVGKQK